MRKSFDIRSVGKLLTVLATTVAYAIVFEVLYPVVGSSSGALVLAPVVLAGFFYGKRAGAIAGLATLPLNFALFSKAGHVDVVFHLITSLPPILVCVLVGVFSGWLSELLHRSKQQEALLAREITERKKSEEALRESNERLELAMQGANLGIWDSDIPGKVTNRDRRWAAMLGYSLEEVQSNPRIFEELVHPDDRKRVMDLVEAHLDGRTEIFETEHRMRTKSGEWKWILNRGRTVVRDAEGKPLRVAGTHMDVTERKRSEERLLLLERAVDAARNGIVITDPSLPDNPIIFVNPSYVTNTGYSQAEVLGKNPRFLQGPETDRSTTMKVRQALNEGREVHTVLRNYKKDGTPFWNELSISPVKDFEGTVTHFIGVQADITERRSIETALKESEQKLWSLIQQSTDGILLTDEKGTIIEWNPAQVAITGLRFEEAVGRPVWDIQFLLAQRERQTPDLYEHLMARILDLLRTGKADWLDRSVEQDVHRSDGSVRNIESVVFPIKTLKGYMLGSIARDVTRQKKANAEIRTLSRAVETTPSGIVLTNLQGIIEYVNPGLLALGNFTEKQEVVGKSIYDFADEAGRQKLQTVVLPELFAGGRWSGEMEVRRKDGSFIPVQMICSVVVDDAGKPKSLLANFYDVSERKQFERELKESEEKYRSVVNNVKEVIFKTDVHGHWTYLNPAWEEITGFTIEDSVGRSYLDFVDREDRERNIRLFKPVVEGAKAYSRHEVLYRHKNGELRWIEVFARLTKDNAGSPTGIAGTLTDVTSRRKAADDLSKAKASLEQRVVERTQELENAVNQLNVELFERKRAEEQVRKQAALLDEAHDAISVRDLDGRVRFWNKGAERVYGWTREQVVGFTMKEIQLSSHEPFDEAVAKVVEKGEWSGEFDRIRKDGVKITVESRWTLIKSLTGIPESILVIDTDITEQKHLQAQFLRAQRMESIGTLAGGIAHDLNNILTPILLWVEVLREKLDDESSRRMLELMESSAHRGSGMVRQLLSFSRGVSGDRVEVQPKHILGELEKFMVESFPKSIRISVNYAKEGWTVMGDATQLHQVLLNLCVNARDAMPMGGILNLRCENVAIDENYAQMHLDAKPGPYAMIAVADTGTGIPPDILEKIFEPFFTTKEVGKGTGLGLSTTMAIVKSHGGFLNVYSEVGRGTTFKVYIPAIERASVVAKIERENAIIRGHGETVLVIDDETMIRDTVKSTIERYGYRVITAEDGAQGVALYSQHRKEIGVVLTDMMMPYMDGPATIRALHRLSPDVKIIGASGLADNEKTVEAKNLKIEGFLKKPFTTRELLTMLNDTIHKNGHTPGKTNQKNAISAA